MKISATLLIFASLLASASAFTPATRASSLSFSSTSVLSSTTPSSDGEFTTADWKGYYTGLGKDRDADMMTKIPKDFGFDPLGFGELGTAGMFFQREAEIKHCRLAMLAAAGWPIAELLDKPLAKLVGADVIVDATDRNPNILNGGLAKISPVYWLVILGVGVLVDLKQINTANENKPDYFPGNLGWDPLNVYPKDLEGQMQMQRKEIANGRLAMIAIAAFVAQEYVSNLGVIDETPAFFKPLF